MGKIWVFENINWNELKSFWGWLTQNYKKDNLVEIILMSIKDNNVYNEVRKFSKENPHIISKKNCQFFINNFEDLKNILSYKEGYFIKNSKICYSLVPRFPEGNEVSGGYKYVKTMDLLFLDVEKVDHGPLTDKEEKELIHYCNNITNYLKTYYNLKNPILVHSGNGVHVLYKIKGRDFNEKRKEGYKKFIKEIVEMFKTPYYIIDDLSNISRCVGLCQSRNPKGEKIVHILNPENLDKQPDDFYIKIDRKKKKTPSKTNYDNLPEIRKSYEYFILTHPDAPKGDLNVIILFAFKLLLIAKGYTNADEEILRELEEEIDDVRGAPYVSLNLSSGVEGKSYSPGIVFNWIKKHKDWWAKYGNKYTYVNSNNKTCK